MATTTIRVRAGTAPLEETFDVAEDLVMMSKVRDAVRRVWRVLTGPRR